MLTNQEKNRYDRHLKLSEVGTDGQERLKSAKVLVVGAGGLGCPVLQYLTAAGVGTIGIIDDDIVSESNLQRQILFSTDDIGKPKVEVAVQKLKAQNPFVIFHKYQERLTNKNVLALFKEFDIIVDGTDNFSTRYLINDACVITNKPLVYGSIYKFEGQISVFNYRNGPTYRCLFPNPPKENQLPNCSDIGVLGVLPGVVGTMQATEVLKIILEKGNVLSGQLRIMNLLDNSSLTLAIKKSQSEIDSVLEKGLLDNYELFCGVDDNKSGYTLEDFSKLMNNLEFVLIDVREEWEEPQIKASNLINLSLTDLKKGKDFITKDRKVVVFCQTGNRSQQVVNYLQDNFGYKNLFNLEGGVERYKA